MIFCVTLLSLLFLDNNNNNNEIIESRKIIITAHFYPKAMVKKRLLESDKKTIVLSGRSEWLHACLIFFI